MKNDIKNILLTETENVDLPMSKKLLDTLVLTKEELLSDDVIKEIKDFEKSFDNNEKFNRKKRFGFKFALSSLCMVMAVFISVISILLVNFNKASDLTTYIIDINPSICITTDKNDSVVSAYSLNDDGDILISNNSFTDIKGKNFDECLKDIISYLIEEEYISFNLEKQKRKINFQVTNNKESFAMEKCKHAREFLNNQLIENGFSDYEIQERFLPVPKFRDKMGFENRSDDLDKMREEIMTHRKYFNPNFVPPLPNDEK